MIGAFALSVGGLGVAVASNGDAWTLGHHNTETKTTKVSDSKGTPLSLKAGKNKPALKVNTTTVVPKLNASMVGGSTAPQLKTLGSAAFTNYDIVTITTVAKTATPLVETAKLPAGLYYVTADAVVTVSSGESVRCYLSTADDSGKTTSFMDVEDSAQGFGTLTDTRAMRVKAGQRVVYYCANETINSDQTIAEQASMTAVRVDLARRGAAAKGHTIMILRKGHKK